MKIYTETSLRDFEFWAGAVELASKLTAEEFDTIESIIEEIAPEDGWSETAINDLFWFDGDSIAEWLGYADEDALLEDRAEEEE